MLPLHRNAFTSRDNAFESAVAAALLPPVLLKRAHPAHALS
jgi:hypothetical protein